MSGFKPIGGTLTPEQEDAIESIVNLPDDAIPKAISGALVESSTTEDATTEEWTFEQRGFMESKNISLVAPTTVEIFVAADLDDLATAGVITIATGENLTLDIKGDLTTSAVRFALEGTAELRIMSINADAVILYNGTGIYISGNANRVSMENVVIVSISTGDFVDLTLPSAGAGTLNILNSAIIGWDDLGTLTGGTALWKFNSFANCDVGLTCIGNTVININNAFETTPLTGPIFDVSGVSVFGHILNTNVVTLESGTSVIRLDPSVSVGTPTLVDNNTVTGGEIFDTTGGSVGTFTAVADAGFASESITSVVDSSGVARFVFTAPPTLFVDQEVVVSGFVTNTDYNGTHIITTVGVGFFEVSSISFGTDEGTGSFISNAVTITDTATTLIDGNTLIIDTAESTDYDGGATVYNQLTNTFQINRTFTTTQAGTWDTSGIDQTDSRVLANNNPDFFDSTVKAEILIFGNSLTTDVPAAGANVMINATTWSTETAERIKADADGDAILTSNEGISAKLDGNVLLEPSSSVKNLSCRFARQDTLRRTVTFDNTTNTVIESSTPRTNGDNLTFHDNAGTLPAELRLDIVYYVVTAAAGTFQLSYALGGAAIAFTDDGSGTNSYAVSDLHGSKPVEPIAANNPRTLVPQALEILENGDKTFIIVTNEDDAVNIEVTDAYYRVVK